MKPIATYLLILSIFTIGGCAQGSAADSEKDIPGRSLSKKKSGVLSSLRPKANPNLVRALEQEESRIRAEQAKQQEAMQQQAQGNNMSMFGSMLDGSGSVLPKVSTEPISAPPAESIASNMPSLNPFDNNNTATDPTAQENPLNDKTLTPADDVMPDSASPQNTQIASYSLHYNPNGMSHPSPGAIAGGGMVPPPPAVTLSTDAKVGYPPPPPNAVPYNPYMQNPYANPYMQNPYSNPYMNPYQIPAPAQPKPEPVKPKRPKGLFGSGQSGGGKSSIDPLPSKKQEDESSNFIPIRPTGMHSRSPYKQRDDLKVLWDGALSSYAFHEVLSEDNKLESILRRVSVGMPPDASRGSFTTPQRRVQTIFRPIRLDKKVSGRVNKLQNDLVQTYYRYLHTYNRYSLAQQTLAARKQQIEVARTRSEKQRAAADMASAENEAQATKEDMRAAQYELAAVAGAKSARSVIQRVSGVTPSVGALAQAEKSVQPIEIKPEGGDGGLFGSMGRLFSGGNKKVKVPKKKKVVAKPKPKPKSKPESRQTKVAQKSSGSAFGFLFGKKDKDLKPIPAKATAQKLASKPKVPAVLSKPKKVVKSPIRFELQNVNITARKSILSVAVKNTGSKNFKLAVSNITMRDGSRKLSKESMRASFDSNLVRPNQEVKGKITIYGRPWNDRLTVSISDGANNIRLKRGNN